MASEQLTQTPPPLDRTLDAVISKFPDNPRLSPADLNHSQSPNPAAQRAVEMVAGSTAELSGEIATLLRTRLRASAMILGIGFALFFIRDAFAFNLARDEQLLLWLFMGVFAVALGMFAVILCRKCEFTAAKLRMMELLIFGLPALFFLWMNLTAAYLWGTTHHVEYARNPVTPWFLLMFNYAMFIPNAWHRAAVVLGSMAAIPILVLGSTTIYMVTCVTASCPVYNFNTLTGHILQLMLAAGSAIFGVFTINRLRTEAYEAKQLGQYKLKRLLGAGGMGEVYLAEHQLMKRPCAIKLIRPGKANDPQALARFEREVRATAKLSHWNSIEIFDYGRTADGTFYYVMEYLPGMSLAEIVDRYGPLPPERVIYLLTQVCDALGEAHALGLIHRDIKPGNIFAAYRGGHFDVAKLLDFGLAKPLLSHESMDLTIAGAITGSPLYMSPEQATGEQNPDARSDIYSLGAVAYYLLTGRSPFQSDNPIKILLAHASETVTPPTRHRPEISSALEAVVLRCLNKRPEERYDSTADLAKALADCAGPRPWTRARAEQWWEAHCESHSDPVCEAAEAIASSEI